MAKNKNTEQLLKKKDIEIAVLKERISRMDKALSNTSRKTLVKDIEETNKEVKQEHKFNFKAWITTSIFAILSLCVGIANMIIHFVDKN